MPTIAGGALLGPASSLHRAAMRGGTRRAAEPADARIAASRPNTLAARPHVHGAAWRARLGLAPAAVGWRLGIGLLTPGSPTFGIDRLLAVADCSAAYRGTMRRRAVHGDRSWRRVGFRWHAARPRRPRPRRHATRRLRDRRIPHRRGRDPTCRPPAQYCAVWMHRAHRPLGRRSGGDAEDGAARR